jgi:hypothetical protein
MLLLEVEIEIQQSREGEDATQQMHYIIMDGLGLLALAL